MNSAGREKKAYAVASTGSENLCHEAVARPGSSVLQESRRGRTSRIKTRADPHQAPDPAAIPKNCVTEGSYRVRRAQQGTSGEQDRKSTRLNSSHTVISYAV